MTAGATALTRGRLAPFGTSLVLAGIDASGSLAVLTGDLTLGSPLPVVELTPTPAFSISLQAGATPMVPGLTAASTLGPVIATTDQFLAFVNGQNGTTVFSSTDGSTWSTQAGPAVLAGTSPTGTATLAPATGTATAVAATGTPVVTAAALDSQGGVVAVGSISAGSTQSAAMWHLAGTTWTAAAISGDAPTSLGSVAVHGGDFVAAANSSGGPRLLYSSDGLSWVEASISGADTYSLTVSSWSGGFVASGVDKSGKAAVWTSSDGLTWVGATWKLPSNAGVVVATRMGLVTTTQGLTGNTSWWWSADGKAWQDSKLTTTGGCWSTLDSGVRQSGALGGCGGRALGGRRLRRLREARRRWTFWASEDARAWQQPMAAPFSFAGSTTCEIAALHQRVVVVGWAKAEVLQDFYGDLTGL